MINIIHNTYCNIFCEFLELEIDGEVLTINTFNMDLDDI